MTSDPSPSDESGSRHVQQLIAAARGGSEDAKRQLPDICRAYLSQLAEQGLPQRLQIKVAPSDIVPETLLEAFQSLAAFTGQSEDELRAWVRRVLLNNMTDAVRRYVDADKRSIDREVPWSLAAPDGSPADNLHADGPSAATAAVRKEEERHLERMIARLPGDYAQVITLHHRAGLSFADIAPRMGRSAEAVRKLWARAIGQLQQKLEQMMARPEGGYEPGGYEPGGYEPDCNSWLLAYELVQRRVLTAYQGRAACRGQLRRLLLGDYLLLEELGRGGMGAVYKVWHLKRKVYAALKTLYCAAPESAARLKREFRILAQRVHPNLVVLGELRQEDDRWFFTMEWVDGQSFTRYIRGPSPPPSPEPATPAMPPAPLVQSAEQWGRLTGRSQRTVELIVFFRRRSPLRLHPQPAVRGTSHSVIQSAPPLSLPGRFCLEW